MTKAIKPKKTVIAAYLIPGIILYTCIVIVPVFVALYYSLFEWTGGPNKSFIGINNYIALLKDEIFWKAFVNNLLLMLICIIGQIGIAFILSCVLNSRMVKFKNFHRSMAYFPATLSAVVIGFVWSLIYDLNYGLLNYVLDFFGREDLKQAWLSNTSIAMLLVSIPIVWQFIGYYLIIFLAGFSSIDTSIFEMAEIDGANWWKRTVYITMPMMKNVFLVCVTLCISGTMKTFDHIYVMTGGGPLNATKLIAIHAYEVSFKQYKMGYGSAVSIGVLLLSLLIIGLSQKIFRSRED